MSHKVGGFQEDNFEQKLLGLKDTQDSIQSLSAWCLKYHQQHKKVVGCWLHVLKKVKVEQRVTLFYLANDIIQYSKRKNYPFVESWATALQKATPLVRDEKVKHKILRLFKIWSERAIYDEAFLSDLCGLLTAHTKKNSTSSADLMQEFQPSSLFSKIRKCKLLEEDTDLKLKLAKECNIPVSDLDALQLAVKDRRNGDDLLQDIDEGIVKLEAYTKALELEIKERIEVINVLEVSEQFYETQRGEAKVVCNAYRNFGNRIKTLKRKLEELLPTLPSPVPSPDINAPSPSSGSDLEMPEDIGKSVCYDSEKSFIGTDFVTAMNAAEKTNQYSRDLSQQNYNPNRQQNYNPNAQQNYNPAVTQSYSSNSQSYYNVQETQNNYDDYMHNNNEINISPAGYYKNNSQTDIVTPASPIDRHLTADPYAYRPADRPEGNPIEVISSSLNDVRDFSDSTNRFLQSLISNPPPAPMGAPTQAKIPGLESPTDNAREVFSFIESKVKPEVTSVPLSWEDKPLTKYQSWPSPDLSWNHTQETPVSPPAFEQESYVHPPVEYIDTNVDSARFQPSSQFCDNQRSNDVDHRLLSTKTGDIRIGCEFDTVATIPLPKHDVDDRLSLHNAVANSNLIPLTDSPSVNDTWKTTDSDYRSIPVPPAPPIQDTCGGRLSKLPLDNIESVDMEMSDDEDTKHEDKVNRHRKSSLKDEEDNYKKTANNQLMPPPSPWEIVTLPNLDNEDVDGRSNTNCGHIRNEMNFNEMIPTNFMSSMRPGIEPPPNLTLPNFPRFPMPPLRPGGPPTPTTPVRGTGPPCPMQFARPSMMSMPPHDLHPRMDFPRPGIPSGNFGQPFNNFISKFSESGPNETVMFPNAVPGSLSQSVRKDSFSDSFVDERRPYQRSDSGLQHPLGSSDTSSYQLSDNNGPLTDKYLRNNITTIESVIKNWPFDKHASNNGASFEPFDSSTPVLNKPSRSNLKEISLSDVLEKTMLRNSKNVDLDNSSEQNEKGELLAIDSDDLFGDETINNENCGDDGDDLYNNIETNEMGDEAESENMNSSQNSALSKKSMKDKPLKENGNSDVLRNVSEQSNKESFTMPDDSIRQRPKIPFQATVPKVARPPMAPPTFMEDDERSPWPLMPVIDLSEENSSPRDHSFVDQPSGEEGRSDQEHNFGDLGFLRGNDTGNDVRSMFNRGYNHRFSNPNERFSFPNERFNSPNERRFMNQMQSPPTRMRGDMSIRRGRFPVPHGGPDFRPRTPNFNNQMPDMTRMPRSQFSRVPVNINQRGNFQNTPRMFKGRPQRPFRRGW